WRLRFLATPAYLAAHRDWQAWLFLARGLLFTGLLGAFLLVVTGKASNVEMQVRLRTAELADLNEVLKEEVSQRRQAQEALQESEARFQAFMDNSPLLASVRDEDGGYVYLNQPLRRLMASQ